MSSLPILNRDCLSDHSHINSLSLSKKYFKKKLLEEYIGIYYAFWLLAVNTTYGILIITLHTKYR